MSRRWGGTAAQVIVGTTFRVDPAARSILGDLRGGPRQQRRPRSPPRRQRVGEPVEGRVGVAGSRTSATRKTEDVLERQTALPCGQQLADGGAAEAPGLEAEHRVQAVEVSLV